LGQLGCGPKPKNLGSFGHTLRKKVPLYPLETTGHMEKSNFFPNDLPCERGQGIVNIGVG
jgi:hypothetical protein